MFYDTKEKRVLSCDTKEENIDSTDLALGEVVSSFLHEYLSVCTRFSLGVEFSRSFAETYYNVLCNFL